jgi:hypothetical protein
MIKIEAENPNDCGAQVVKILRTQYLKFPVNLRTQRRAKNVGLGFHYPAILPLNQRTPTRLPNTKTAIIRQ